MAVRLKDADTQVEAETPSLTLAERIVAAEKKQREAADLMRAGEREQQEARLEQVKVEYARLSAQVIETDTKRDEQLRLSIEAKNRSEALSQQSAQLNLDRRKLDAERITLTRQLSPIVEQTPTQEGRGRPTMQDIFPQPGELVAKAYTAQVAGPDGHVHEVYVWRDESPPAQADAPVEQPGQIGKVKRIRYLPDGTKHESFVD